MYYSRVEDDLCGGERGNATSLVAGIMEVKQIGKIVIYVHGLDLNVV